MFDETRDAFSPDEQATVPYRWSEVIHRSGTKAGNEALERERAQIVNNFAPRRVSYHE
jgi:hypothetical protein